MCHKCPTVVRPWHCRSLLGAGPFWEVPSSSSKTKGLTPSSGSSCCRERLSAERSGRSSSSVPEEGPGSPGERGESSGGGPARESGRVRKGRPHQPARMPLLPAPPPRGTASGPRPGASASCRRSAAGLEEREGDGGTRSLGTSHPLASPPLTARVLLAGPVDCQHIQRVEDGAVGAHRAGVPMPRRGESCHQDPVSGRRWGAALGGLTHLPLLSSNASSSGM